MKSEKSERKESGQSEKRGRSKGQLEKRFKFSFRVNGEERVKILENAKGLGLNVSEYLRLMAIEKRVKVIRPKKVEIDLEVLTQLKKVGNNLNQLLKFLHSTKAQYLTYEEVLNCLILLGEIKKIYQKILEQLV